MRAVVRNNAAFALTMSSVAPGSLGEDSLRAADQLSAEAYAAFPCLLAYRSTRALVLAALGRATEALELLEYLHFESAPAADRGQREGVRAFALHRLRKTEEGKRSARAAIELNPRLSDMLNELIAVA